MTVAAKKESDFPGIDPRLVQGLTRAVRARAAGLIPVLSRLSPDAARVLRSEEFVRDAVMAALPSALPRPDHSGIGRASLKGVYTVIRERLGLHRHDGEWRLARRAAVLNPPVRFGAGIDGLPDIAAPSSPHADDAREVVRIIDALPPVTRHVLTLRFDADQSLSAIARGLGMSRAAVRGVYARGVASVRATCEGKTQPRRDAVMGDDRLVRLKIRAAYERVNALAVQAGLLAASRTDLEFRHFEGIDRDASRAASRVIAAVTPDLDRLDAASEILARLRLGSEVTGPRRREQLAEDVRAVELDIRKLERGAGHPDTSGPDAKMGAPADPAKSVESVDAKGATQWDRNEKARRFHRRR